MKSYRIEGPLYMVQLTLWEANQEDEIDGEESYEISADHLIDHHHKWTHDLETSAEKIINIKIIINKSNHTNRIYN